MTHMTHFLYITPNARARGTGFYGKCVTVRHGASYASFRAVEYGDIAPPWLPCYDGSDGRGWHPASVLILGRFALLQHTGREAACHAKTETGHSRKSSHWPSVAVVAARICMALFGYVASCRQCGHTI